MKCFRKIILFGLLVTGFLVMAVCTGSAGTDSSPTAQLKISIDQMLEVLKNPELKAEDQKEIRRQQLRQIARQRFDYRRMSQLSLGKHWKDRNDREKDEFTDLFSDLLENTYVAKIESYTDEEVVYLKERVKKKKTKEYAKINTKIITDTVEIPIDYMMYRKSNTPWRVYDMVIEGVSMVSNYRSQFGKILERQSFESLVEKLKEKKE